MSKTGRRGDATGPCLAGPRLSRQAAARCRPATAAALLLLALGCGNEATRTPQTSQPPARIVSMAPSATEILFALGLGVRVLGVTRYCDYPPEVKQKRSVGGFLDPNYEVIVALEPDLVVLVTAHREVKAQLERLGLETLTVKHDLLADVPEAIRVLGERCGAEERARELITDLERRIDAVRRAAADLPRPRVLMCVGRDVGAAAFDGVYIAGRHNFQDEIIELAGGVNAVAEGGMAYPVVSLEGLVRLRPEVIVEVVAELPAGTTRDEVAAQWRRLGDVPAVTSGRIHVVVGGHALRPGPRLIDLAEELLRLLHPEAAEGAR
ncbi:MAG: helical backbone metal receptor [Planctomycetota bacterium]